MTAIKYHTPRLVLVPELRDAVEVVVPEDRGPGLPWRAEEPIRIGYAHANVHVRDRASAAEQELRGQIAALEASRCERIFSEQLSVRIKARPELEAALEAARTRKAATPDRPVVLIVRELRHLARTAAELMAVAASLQAGGIRVELLTGPLAGSHDPCGDTPGLFFRVLESAAQLDREHVREKTLEGQREAAAKGNHSGRPKVFDEEMLTLARTLRDEGVPIPEIAERLVITTGKNAGRHPSLASVYRALAEPEVAEISETFEGSADASAVSVPATRGGGR